MKLTCIIIDDEPHAIFELKELISLHPKLQLLESFIDAQDAIEYLFDKQQVDIVFSDISMPRLNGLNAGKVLSRYCHYLIYVTAHKEFALDAFGVSASGFLTKPVMYSDFMERLENVINKHESVLMRKASNETILFVKGGLKNSFIKVKYDDIIYIEASLNYIIIHTIMGNHMTYISLKSMDEKLASLHQFIRISKSIIISIKHINKVDGNSVMMSDKKTHELGSTYKSAFLDFLKKRTLNP